MIKRRAKSQVHVALSTVLAGLRDTLFHIIPEQYKHTEAGEIVNSY